MPRPSKKSSSKKQRSVSKKDSSPERSPNLRRQGKQSSQAISSASKTRRHTSYDMLDQKPEYLKQVLQKNSTLGSFTCIYCSKPNEHTGWVENAEEHIRSAKHKKKTPIEDQSKLRELLLNLSENTKQKANDNSDEMRNQSIKSYLELIAFLVNENLSFSQISNIGKFFKKFINRETLKIFHNFSFDREEISRVVKDCFGENLLKELQEKLEEKPYSFTIDCSKICGENICGLTVKYLDTVLENNIPVSTKICHKVIGVQRLEDKSTAEVFKEIVENKIFINSNIKANCIGISHDYASTLGGVHKGLTSLIRKSLNKYIFELKDPCHGLNLSISNSLKKLPKEIMNFIRKIHAHFSSPQRRAKLNNIQRRLSLKELSFVKYVPTRWLSLESCLQRLIELWEPLQIYFDENLKELSKNFQESSDEEIEEEEEEDGDDGQEIEPSNKNVWHKLLLDPIFKLKISFLLSILEKVNCTIKFSNLNPFKFKRLSSKSLAYFIKSLSLCLFLQK